MDKKELVHVLSEKAMLNEYQADIFSQWLNLNFDGSLKEMDEKKEIHFEYTAGEIEQKGDGTLAESVLLEIDCEANNSVDIRCGGPEYLGYDFVIEKENKEELKQFIIENIKKSNQPFISMREVPHKKIKRSSIWTKTDILQHLQKTYEPTLSKRNYSVSLPGVILTR